MVAKASGPATSDESAPRAEVELSTDWGAVTTWEAAIAEFGIGEIIPAADAFGDGSQLTDNKDELCGVAFLVLDWRYVTDPQTDRQYVNVLVMLKESQTKVRFNDGSTGVADQCRAFEEKRGKRGGIYCPRGLRRSDYTVEIDGKKQAATTYYFDN